MSDKRKPAAILAASLLATSMLVIPAQAQTQTTSSDLTVSGSQPYNLTCNVTGPQLTGVSGPSGTFNFTDVTTGMNLGSANLGTPSAGYPTYPSGQQAGVLVTGDLNGDGNLDVVAAGRTANGTSSSISVLLGTGSGSFQSPIVTNLPVGLNGVASMAVGDFDKDGMQDLVITGNDSMYFLKGLGNGTFQSPVPIAISLLHANQLVAGDFDEDGNLDIVFTTFNPGGIAFLHGNGNGTFQAPQFEALQASPTSIIAADFNKDHHLDLAVAGDTNGVLEYTTILLGTGTGSFGPPTTYSLYLVNSLAAGDFDGDGVTDLAVAFNPAQTANNGGSSTVGWMKGNGDGTFQAPIIFDVSVGNCAPSCPPDLCSSCSPSPEEFSNIVAADLNGDGHLDLSVSDPENSNIHVFLGDGQGNFQAPQDLGDGKVEPPQLVAGALVSSLHQMQLVAPTFPSSGIDPTSVTILALPQFFAVSASATIPNLSIPAELPVTHQIECSYSGDSNYAGSTSAAQTITLPTAPTPVIQPASGSYPAPLQVSIGSVAGASIYYTTDGTQPTILSPQYSGPITVTSNETIQAIAASPDYFTSGTGSATYTMEAATAAPVISPTTGAYKLSSPNLQVTITAASGATIYYTTDGTQPTTSSTQYTGPFNVSGQTFVGISYPVVAVQAIAVVAGQSNSPVASAVYALNSTSIVGFTNSVTLFTNSDFYCGVTGLGVFSSSGATGNVTLNDITGGQSLGSAPLDGFVAPIWKLLPYSANPVAGASTAAFLVTGDFNGDHKPDLAVSTNAGISVLLGNGDGTFQAPVPVAGTGLGQMATADINGDGKLDLIYITGTGFATMLGNGDGTFQAPVFHNLISAATGIVAGNFGNGSADLAFTIGNSVVVVLGNGDGTFKPGVTYPVGDNPRSLVAADFRGDGTLSLAVTNGSSISVLLGNGDGTFASQVVTNNLSITSISAADLNHDGRADIAATIDGGTDGQILLGNGDGTFQYNPQLTLIGPDYPSPFVIGDFNHDGIPDLAASAPGPPAAVWVWLGKGNESFTSPTQAPVGAVGTPVAADFSGSGESEIAVATTMSGNTTQTSISIVHDTLSEYTLATFNDVWVPQGTTPLTRNYQCSYGGDANFQGSESYTFSYTFTALPPPLFSLLVGSYNSPQSVAIYPQHSFGTVYYTTDGSDPTPNSTRETSAIPVTSATTFKAITVAPGWENSTVSEASYIVASTPQFSLPAGIYTPGQSVTITAATAGSTIYYTTDGSTPTTISPKYTAPVKLSGDMTLKSMATAPGYINSAIASATYTLSTSATVTKLASSSTTVNEGQQITLTATVTGVNPTGTVTFTTGSTTLGKSTLSNGTATLQTSFASAGSYPITAAYSGDANNLTSTSNVATVIVVAPSFTISANPTTQTITAGQSASFTITATSLGGYSNSMSFACQNLPSNATCAFNPATLTPSAGGASTKLTLSTTAPSQSAKRDALPWRSGGTLALAGLLGFFLRRRRTMGWLRAWYGMLLLAVALLAVSACGGGSGSGSGSGSGGGNSGTPAGSYSVSVTATGSGAASQSLKIELVVQ